MANWFEKKAQEVRKFTETKARQIGTAGAAFIPGHIGDPYRAQVTQTFETSRLPVPVRETLRVLAPPESRGELAVMGALALIPGSGFVTKTVGRAAVKEAAEEGAGLSVRLLAKKTGKEGVENIPESAGKVVAKDGVDNIGTKPSILQRVATPIQKHPYAATAIAGLGGALAVSLTTRPGSSGGGTFTAPPGPSGGPVGGPGGGVTLPDGGSYFDPNSPTSQGGPLERIGGGIGEFFSKLGGGIGELFGAPGAGAGQAIAQYGGVVLVAAGVGILIYYGRKKK